MISFAMLCFGLAFGLFVANFLWSRHARGAAREIAYLRARLTGGDDLGRSDAVRRLRDVAVEKAQGGGLQPHIIEKHVASLLSIADRLERGVSVT